MMNSDKNMAENVSRTSYGKPPAPDAPRPIVLCADDYALAPGVSDGIRALLAAGRLSATSCMTVTRHWPEEASHLGPLAASVDLGLHLTLTDLAPLGPMPHLAPDGRLPSLRRLITAAFHRRLLAESVRREIGLELRRQLMAFVAAMGRPPDFIDGHQHVHVLSGIREEVVALFEDGALPAGTGLRVPWEARAAIWRRGVARARALTLSTLSAGLRRRARETGLPANDSFRGMRQFRREEDYPALFRRFLTGAGERPLIMCHPGHVDDALRRVDPVTDCRAQEFAYFASATFAIDLAAAGRRLARVREWHANEQPSPSGRAAMARPS